MIIIFLILFLPIIIFILILSVVPTIEDRKLKIFSEIFISLLTLILFSQPIESQEKRRETGYWDKTDSINSFKKSSDF